MKLRFLLRLIALSVAGVLRAAEATPAEPPLRPLQFFVGGVWRGKLPAMPDGRQPALETTFSWMENKQVLRFDTLAANGERRSGYSSGIYGWHPARKKIVFWYFDSAGTLYEGTVTVEDDTLTHEFTATDRAGKVSPYRAVITRVGGDAYDNAIFHQADGKWEQFVVVRYERVKD